MDLSWTPMLITQVLTVLYVAWLTASLRGTQQKMDKYVENYVSIIKTMKDSHYLFRFKRYLLLLLYFCFFPDQSCR
jgi:hypothetical protein